MAGPSSIRIIAGLCCDSRQCRPGFLFAALPGVQVDGADYIEQAIDNGAVAVMGSLRRHAVLAERG